MDRQVSTLTERIDELAAERRIIFEEGARELTGGKTSLWDFRLSRSLRKDNVVPSR